MSHRFTKEDEKRHRVRRPDATQGSGRSPDLPFLEQILDTTVGMISLGCPKNSIDSEIMLGLLEKSGFKITSKREEAQIIIINTCSFIESAKIESIDAILEIAELKKKNNYLKSIIVTGCLPQRYKNKLKKEIPEIDFLLGLNHVPEIVKICMEIIKRNKRSLCGANQLEDKAEAIPPSPLLQRGVKGDLNKERIATPFGLAMTHKTDPEVFKNLSWCLTRKTGIYKSNLPRKLLTPKSTAYVKITDGCDNRCSYCTIPYIRGHFRSREVSSIINEVTLLAGKGVKEINLIGQDTTNYGRDLSGTINLKTLLRKLIKINGIQWFRILYTYPSEIDQGLIEMIYKEEKICRYLDIPIQHIDNEILKKMRRRYTGADIYCLIENIRKSIPDISLRTSIITGFPCETDKQFERLCRFINEIEFNHLGVFSYSREEGTKAFSFRGQIPEKVKMERVEEIMKIQRKISLKKNRKLIGTYQKVLVEGPSKETPFLLQGRTQGQAPEVDGVTYINRGKPEIGKISDVLITDVLEYDLVGRII